MMPDMVSKTRRIGAPLGVALVLALATSVSAQTPPTYLTEWGSMGSGDGQFNYPTGIAVDGSGNVYVADALNDTIQKFSSAGAFIARWGTSGSGDGQLDGPWGVAVDGAGNVYVVETNNNRIQKFTTSGAFLGRWGSMGSGPGEFDAPQGIGVDASGNVYVADTNNNRIQKFDSSGAYLLEWDTGNGTAACPGSNVCDSPRGVAPDLTGNVYVVSFNSRVQKFDASGGFSGTIWGASATLRFPQDLAVGPDGNVYVPDTDRDNIKVFDGTGTQLSQWGTLGTGPGEFNNPQDVAVDSQGNVYVADTGNRRIQKFGALAVAVDVKPGSDPNCFNLNGHGVIPVAILGSATFDVTAIDVDTLTFDGLAVRVRGNKGPLCSLEDTDLDTYTDLVCHFEDDPVNWIGGGATGTVSGSLLDGTPFAGSDSICIVP